MKTLTLAIALLVGVTALPAQAAGLVVGAHLDNVTVIYRDGSRYWHDPYYAYAHDHRVVHHRHPHHYYSSYDYRPTVVYFRDDHRDSRRHRHGHGRHHHSRHCRH